MDKKEIERLRYRRQYLLAPREVNCPFKYNLLKVKEGYFLYVHLDLPLTHYSNGNLNLFLLGDIFDYEPDNKSNLAILGELAAGNSTIDKLLAGLERYMGCFVLVVVMDDQVRIVNDPYATRKIFWSQMKGEIWCASNLHLLARILGHQLSEGESQRAYRSSERFVSLNNGGIAAATSYDEIKQVLPNHFLKIEDGTVERFWPLEKRIPLSVTEVVEKTYRLIEGYVHNIASRYEVMLPITAGKDSRTLLAATRELHEEVFYYINKVRGSDTSIPDFTLPVELSRRLGIDFHVLDADIEVDEDFERIYFENNPHALGQFLPMIYNYYLHYEGKVNLPGSIATGGQWWYPIYRKNKTVDTLLDINKLGEFSHAREAYSDWLKDCRPSCDNTGFELLDLFYWEERLGNWGSQIQQDKDIAQLDINPFNSRLLVKIMLSVEPTHTLEFASYPVNRNINMKLWPETMSMQINPGRKNTLLRMVEKFGLLGVFYRIKYR